MLACKCSEVVLISTTGLSIISEDVANEKAAISQSSGSKANSGTRFEESQFINAEELFEEQVEANEAVEDGQLLSAAVSRRCPVTVELTNCLIPGINLLFIL